LAKPREIFIETIVIDPDDEQPKFQQLYRQIREQIVNRTLAAGTRLPSTRKLAKDLAISRNTTTTAYEQLASEGYIETRQCSVARVANLPEVADETVDKPLARLEETLASRGRELVSLPHQTGYSSGYRLQPGLPDAREFPFNIWRRLVAEQIRHSPGESFGYHSYAGHQRLREVVASYMQSSRGISCKVDQVMITSGAQSAFNLLSHLLIDTGDSVLFEEPGYTGAQGAFLAAGGRLRPLRVHGGSWEVEAVLTEKPKVIYVTPSCQFPLGATMRIEERLQILKHAQDVGAWIIEDDFDSEFRFHSNRVPTLQSADTSKRTIYVGTFAKTMLPDLRLGFIVFPGEVDKSIRKTNFLMGSSAPLVFQAALADFIEQGYFARHTRRMKRIYQARRTILDKALHENLSDWMEQVDEGNGLQSTWRFREAADDVEITRRAVGIGISPTALSIHYRHDRPEHGFMVGYAATSDAAILRSVESFRTIVEGSLGRRA
jgi:GntR family transcriptional regulator / MocR family aminotransferase